MIGLADYRARWDAEAMAWAETRQADPEGAEARLRALLDDGVEAVSEPSIPPSAHSLGAETRLAAEAEVIRLSGALDIAGYTAANRDSAPLRAGELDPIEHYCRTGWRWLRSPRVDFDNWWYWSEHLDPTADDVNPFVHYLILGRHLGLSVVPPSQPVRADAPRGDAAGVRRVCLFAAYDIDGVVDDYVLAYLTELSRHADVYYLADGVMRQEQLDRLSGATRGAWAVPHGRYDFGSFSLLARDYVGWDVLDEYDELLLANDSCYLLRDLDEVFSRMASVSTDWWGLQATKRDFDESRGHQVPIPLPDAKALATEEAAWSEYFRLHLSSYFLLFRKRVMLDAGFRRRLDAVVAQPHKGLVILKYEIGLSDYLFRSGYDCETFIPDLYPFHPLYSGDYFTLLAAGFPLLKRNFITDNTRRTPDLANWRDRVLAAVPDAPVEMFEQNMRRVAADDRLKASLSIRTMPDGSIEYHQPLNRRAFRSLERNTPTFDHWWAFPVCRYDHTFAGNERAVFEEVRDDPSIKKIILTRSRRVEITGENVVIVPIESPEGQQYLARAGQIFVKHGPTINVPWPLPTTAHNFINLWHGIPLKRFGTAALALDQLQHDVVIRNNGGSRAIVTSSRMDALAMTSAFFPASYPDLWNTGLPRNDFIVCAEERLPADLRASVERLREEVAGRRLVLFLPTFKDDQAEAYYRFSDDDLAVLASWAKEHDAVIGVREHMADRAHTYSRMLAPLGPIDVSSRRFPDLEVLYRVADALVSDYSSCLVDFMMTGKPVVSFAYDYDRYATAERGLFYQLDRVLPGPVCRTFAEFEAALHGIFAERSPEEIEEYDWRRRIFFDRVDDRAASRVVERVKRLYVDAD